MKSEHFIAVPIVCVMLKSFLHKSQGNFSKNKQLISKEASVFEKV
jgi:hypothetical protein